MTNQLRYTTLKSHLAPSSKTLLVSRSEYPRDKPFLLTMVSYLKKKIKIKL
jgi:hypothetical protein